MIRHITPCRLVEDVRRVFLDRAALGSSFSTVHIYQAVLRHITDVFNPE